MWKAVTDQHLPVSDMRTSGLKLLQRNKVCRKLLLKLSYSIDSPAFNVVGILVYTLSQQETVKQVLQTIKQTVSS